MHSSPPQPRQLARAFIAMAAAAGVAGLLADAAYALPITGGPTYSAAGDGYQEPSQPIAPGATLNNAGTTIGYAIYNQPGHIFGGARGYRYSPDFVAGEYGTLGTGSDGHRASQPFTINKAGVAVGGARKYNASLVDIGTRPVRWEANTLAATELGVFGTNASGSGEGLAYDINTAGVSVGYVHKYIANVRVASPAVRWNAGSLTPIELGSIGLNPQGHGSASAYAINDSNVAAGLGYKYAGGVYQGIRAVRWSAAGVATELGNLGTAAVVGDTVNLGLDLNNAGTVVGRGDRYNGSGVSLGQRALRWAAGGTAVVELANLGTNSDGIAHAQATDLNEPGVAIGYSMKYTAAHEYRGYRGVRWAGNTTAATELPPLALTAEGAGQSYAQAINNLGFVCGYSAATPGSSNPNYAAVVWTPANVVVDLNTLINGAATGFTLTEANAVSDTGFVAGVGNYDPDGAGGQAAYSRAFTMMVPQFGTYGRGDGDLDGDVDFSDLLLLGQQYNTANTLLGLHRADLNLDGMTDFADLLALSQNYGSAAFLSTDAGFSAHFVADWALAQSLVPEPASVVLLAGAMMKLTARRRRA